MPTQQHHLAACAHTGGANHTQISAHQIVQTLLFDLHKLGQRNRPHDTRHKPQQESKQQEVQTQRASEDDMQTTEDLAHLAKGNPVLLLAQLRHLVLGLFPTRLLASTLHDLTLARSRNR
jgi:hypothetical protein